MLKIMTLREATVFLLDYRVLNGDTQRHFEEQSFAVCIRVPSYAMCFPNY